MRRIAYLLFAFLVWSGLGGSVYAATAADDVTTEIIRFAPFNEVKIYRTANPPRDVMLFVSGDGGWDIRMIRMAKQMLQTDALTDTLVVGIDIVTYFAQLGQANDQCAYPAAHFEALSHYLQKKYNFPEYRQPILAGYSCGATLVYAILAQAPPNTFRGAISLGFCPDLLLPKTLCRGAGLTWKPDPKSKGVIFQPKVELAEPWIVLQGTLDQVCIQSETEAFVKQIPKAEIMDIEKVKHGFSITRNWLAQFQEAYQKIAKAADAEKPTPISAAELKGLPLVELPVPASPADFLAVIISGDGGWASLDKDIGEYFNQQGIGVVGLNSLKYFWQAKTPEIAGQDLAKILAYYAQQWQKDKFVLVGYSLGADVLPFMINRLPAALRQKIRLTALLGLDQEVDFEFHLSDWLGGGSHKNAKPVLPEVQQLKNRNVLCIYGAAEKESLCRSLHEPEYTLIETGGAHHFGGNYAELADRILAAVPQK